MYKNLISILLVAGALGAQTSSKTASLEGLDPVLLTEGQEVSGKASITAQRGRFLYQFSTEETRDRFNKEPEKYSIQLDGACARMGPPVGGSPDTYWVYDHRIYIFGSNECYKTFSANPTKFLESAQPKPAWSPTAETRAQGQALLKKAIEAMGGTAKLDAIKSYIETRHPVEHASEVTMTKYVRMPDYYRDETARGANKFGTLLAPGLNLRIFRDEGLPVPESFAAVVRKDWKRELLPILLSRDSKGFDVYAKGAGEIAVNYEGSVLTILIEPASGRISAIVWNGHTENGFEEMRLVYSDYRETGGLQLPFHIELMAAGKPSPGRSLNVESYQFNPPAIDAAFQKPAKIREQ